MVKKVIAHCRLIPVLESLLRFRKNTFLLVLCFCLAFSFTALKGVGSDEFTEDQIRAVLQQGYNGASNKGKFAKESAGITESTLKKFLRSEKTTQLTLRKIRGKFAEHNKKTSVPTSSAPSQTSSSVTDSASPSEDPPAKAYPCLNLSAFPFHSSFPETYSLFMLDPSLVPQTTAWDQHAQFMDIGQRFLRPTLATDKDLSFAKTEKEAQQKKRWLLKEEKTMPGVNKDKKTFHVVQLFKKREKQRAANLVQALTVHQTSAFDGFDFEAGLIIFPYSHQRAMTYGLGRWASLLNPDCILSQWGLRLATSGQVCNPDKVKGLSEVHYRTSNPVSRRDKVAVPEPIEGFGLEVGSEELKAICLMPNKSVATQHVIEGRDYLQFTVNPSDQATLEQTLHSLHLIATHFFTLTTDPNFRVHSRMREFIDDEVREGDLLKALNEHFQRLLRAPEGKELIFLHDDLWREMKSKKLQFGEGKSRSIFEAFDQLPPKSPVPQTVQVWKPQLASAREFDVRRIFYTLPLEHEGKFYRFDRTHWYEVDPSRFEGVKRMLRKVKSPSCALQLPDYSLEDTKRSKEEKKADYKEAKYNLRAAQEVQKAPGWRAILLDRINVSLGEAHSQFEFADLLLIHNNTFYIVHVKRANASQLSHLREQVERSVDFLTTELVKTNAHTLFLQGIVHRLYERNELPVTKEKKQGTTITKGHVFLDYYESTQQNFLLTLSQQFEQNPDEALKNFTQNALKVIDREFFNQHLFELATALDALFDCVFRKKPISDAEIAEFLEAVKQAIQAREFLFPNGPLKKSDLPQVKVVLALIDDRAIDADIKGKKTRSQALFKRQDLWGLDRTRTEVERRGLGFVLTVINENVTETQDAFGAIVKRETADNFIGLEGDEPELPFSSSSPQSSSFSDASFKPPQKDLQTVFNEAGEPTKALALHLVQKIHFHDLTQFPHPFFIIPAIGDGNCFFHTAFTDQGDDVPTVQLKAADMRKQLCDAVQQGHYMDDLRPLVYEHFMGLLANNDNHPEVPEDVRKYVQDKNDYTSMYNSMQRFGIPIDEAFPTPENRFPIDGVLALISPDQIRTYMERFRHVGGDETYIPFRPNMRCPVDLFAHLGKRQIRVFTFHTTDQRLYLQKGAGTEGPLSDILHVGNHFVRLYYSSGGEAYLPECEQIWANYLSWLES